MNHWISTNKLLPEYGQRVEYKAELDAPVGMATFMTQRPDAYGHGFVLDVPYSYHRIGGGCKVGPFRTMGCLPGYWRPLEQSPDNLAIKALEDKQNDLQGIVERLRVDLAQNKGELNKIKELKGASRTVNAVRFHDELLSGLEDRIRALEQRPIAVIRPVPVVNLYPRPPLPKSPWINSLDYRTLKLNDDCDYTKRDVVELKLEDGRIVDAMRGSDEGWHVFGSSGCTLYGMNHYWNPNWKPECCHIDFSPNIFWRKKLDRDK